MGVRRIHRLKSRSEFASVYRNGKPLRGGFVILRTVPTNGPVTRFGFTAGRGLGSAVVRNRVKRRLREIVRALSVSEGWDIVLNARSDAVGANYADLAGRIESMMLRAGVLK